MSLNKIENFFLILYIYLAPILYVSVPITLFGGSLGKIIAIILLALFGMRIFLSFRIPDIPKVGVERFLLYVVIISTFSLFIAIPFAAKYAGNLTYSAQPIPRYIVQMGSLLTMLPIFYYSYRYASKQGEKFQKHLINVFGILVLAGMYQLLAFYMDWPFWGISMDRDVSAIKSIGPIPFLRINSLAGEPKGFASLLLIFLIPFILFRNRFHNNWNSLLGYGVLILFIFTFSASGYGTFLIGIVLAVYILVTKIKVKGGTIYRAIGSLGTISTLGFLASLILTPVRDLMLLEFERIGAATGLNSATAFMSQMYVELPFLGEIPFDATDASPIVFMLNYPLTMITGVGDGMISIYAREFFGSFSGWLGPGYDGVIDPSLGLIQHLADWGLIGILFFAAIIWKILTRAEEVINSRIISHKERNLLLFWAVSLIPMSLYIINIGNGYSGLLLPGLVIGYSTFLENKYSLR